MTIIFKILVPSGFWILLVVMWLLSPPFPSLYMPPNKLQISLCLSVTNVCFFMKLVLQGQGKKPLVFTVTHVTPLFFPFCFFVSAAAASFYLSERSSSWLGKENWEMGQGESTARPN